MSPRRPDDQILELSLKIASTPDEDVEPLLRELQGLIHEKIKYLRQMAADEFVKDKRRKQRRTLAL